MGTWSAAIFGNDTSCEVKEYFFEQYNLGKLPTDLHEEILSIYSKSLGDKEERYNILLALAHCLWQVKELPEKTLTKVRQIIANGSDLQICKALGANTKFLKEREKALNKLLSDISTPKATAKKRVKPPVPTDSIYRNGCCLAFQYDDKKWGALITVESSFFKRKATLMFAQTDIKQSSVPTMEDVNKAHLLDNYFDMSSKYEHHHKLSLYGSHFFGTKERPRLEEYNEKFFTVIGHLPEWHNAYAVASSGRQPYAQEEYAEFASIIQHSLSRNFENNKHTRETIKDLSSKFEETI
jgi:hypothetical protein